ncbi:MAG TPA: hypothetical protein VHG29_11310 [Novosphingobium sp.]|nr:hypothetical protein [Novosphingobium sp.]
MKRVHILLGATLALTSAWAVAQDAPESLLPPGFDKPSRPARSTPAPAPKSGESAPAATSSVVQAIPGVSTSSAPRTAVTLPANIPSLRELEAMSPDELDQLLGLRPKYDIPPGARRSLKQIGILSQGEGGFPAGSMSGQNPGLVRAMLTGNNGQMVSRWGHILLRRALASRMDAPAGMNPADFAGMRAALLVRMGEGDAARALVQDVDAANYSPLLTQAALDAFVATGDITGICPAVALQGGVRKDADWTIARAICASFGGEGAAGMTQLDRALSQQIWPKIDVLLAQKYAGAAGKARRAVTVEWDGVEGMNPWRYALTIATGLEPPAALMRDAAPRYDYVTATAPMVGLPARAAAADRAAAAGVLSGQAMVDLYGQIYAQDDISDEWSARAEALRAAYAGDGADAQLAAIRQLWDGATDPQRRYGRQVLTAYAAARLPVNGGMANDAPELIASMLTAGLDRNALRWAPVADSGSQAWALLTLVAPARSGVSASAVENFYGDDNSDEYRKSRFLLAGLAGLGRIDAATTQSLASKMDVDLIAPTSWTRAIDGAAEVNNAALVAMLAGLGMQGEGWDKMTPRYLYHIVSALNRVGLGAEARMIAAEAVARG